MSHRNTGQSALRRIIEATEFTNTCWLWKGGTNRGYGRIAIAGRATYVHVYVYSRLVQPTSLNVLHTCDVRNCWRPSHLWEGTDQDNMRDMESKGRGNHVMGSAASSSKLTEDDIVYIRESSLRPDELAVKFDVTRRNIYKILNRENWRQLP